MITKDIPATEAAKFSSTRSYVDLEGHLHLFGWDWREQQLRVLIRDEFICQRCHQPFDLGYDIVDTHHVVKRSNGGTEDLGNLISVHRACHNDAHPEHQTRFGKGSEMIN